MRHVGLVYGVLLLVCTLPWLAPSELGGWIAGLLAAAPLLLPVAHLRLRPASCPDLAVHVVPVGPERRASLGALLLLGVPLLLLPYWGLPSLPLPPGPELYPAPTLVGAFQLGFGLLGVLLTSVLPQEVFFRLYLQGALDDGGGPRVLGTRLHRGVWLQAVAAALAHALAAGGSWAALEQFVPALLLGACRARTGSLWPGILLHLLLATRSAWYWLPQLALELS